MKETILAIVMICGPLLIGYYFKNLKVAVLAQIVVTVLYGVGISSREVTACEKSIVKAIGGCSRYGHCAIDTDHGKSYLHMPLVGEKIKVCKTTYKDSWYESNRRGHSTSTRIEE